MTLLRLHFHDDMKHLTVTLQDYALQLDVWIFHQLAQRHAKKNEQKKRLSSAEAEGRVC
ncbi:MAG TPA: hypothetical protein VE954_04895 [Oligoflexus sp.]|nr:hypothetical protein [Oligoflexus sp.]